MGIKQFVNSIRVIARSEHIKPSVALASHLRWQTRRLFRQFPVFITVSNSVFKVNSASGVGALLNCLKMYDYNNMHLVKLFLSRIANSTFFDVGGNIGSYALLASEVESGRVISFEPHPESAKVLQENINLNGRKNVQIFELGLSDIDGEVAMTNFGYHSAVNRILDLSNPTLTDKHIIVSVRRADTVCATLGLFPTICKIDVEGHDLQVLKGFGTLLTSIVLLIIENGTSVEVLSYLKERGFGGPYYFHFKSFSFRKNPQRRSEDPVFLNSRHLEQLHIVGAYVIDG